MESKDYSSSACLTNTSRVASLASLTNTSPSKQFFKSALARNIKVLSLDQAMPNQSTPRAAKKFQKDLNMDFDFHRARKSLDYMEDVSPRMNCAKTLNEDIGKEENVRSDESISIKNMFLEGEVDKLKWQLRLMENNRDMYHALMQEMVKFLQRCSVDLIGSQSDANSDSSSDTSSQRSPTTSMETESSGDFTDSRSSASFKKYKEYYSNRSTKRSSIPPASGRIAKEAFRLLRTAQNLVNTKEPDLRRAPSSPVFTDKRSSIGSQSTLRKPMKKAPVQSPLKKSLCQSNADLFWDKVDGRSSRLSLPLIKPNNRKEAPASSTEDEGLGGSVKSVGLADERVKAVNFKSVYRNFIAKQSLLKRISSLDLISKK